MSIQERKKREKEEMRNRILNTASEIISKEGVDGLSMRKIAKEIEYSPAIIYHYFNDKEDIVNCLMKKTYEKILITLSQGQNISETPKEKLGRTLREYINLAMGIPEEYKTILLNNSPMILAHTSTLFKGASKERKALAILKQCIIEVLDEKSRDENELELTTQIVWTATFGLILRLIIEKDIDKEQQKLLIENHIKFVLNGIYKKGDIL